MSATNPIQSIKRQFNITGIREVESDPEMAWVSDDLTIGAIPDTEDSLRTISVTGLDYTPDEATFIPADQPDNPESSWQDLYRLKTNTHEGKPCVQFVKAEPVQKIATAMGVDEETLLEDLTLVEANSDPYTPVCTVIPNANQSVVMMPVNPCPVHLDMEYHS